ncbi:MULTISPECIES: BREX system serine/threonine kinase PglW [unclassified Actinopolyspora]|uniref:BREX system serine/threonine kinase PglW n=1 Tax=unclassified Actinopolyspora TaxID=2639451 RepID=UPI0013F603E3|nr:BREX system serine/threonine kinase PglW [Actinopolyspora sp. BKK2]NHE77247.1 BREX system serine/threonine kinase PglW [Actinopolyspora sp. BKK1]
MDAESQRWHPITPSQFPHERAALEHVRELLPDVAPYQAWSNFTFMSQQGHIREVDLLLATPAGLRMIEIKSLRGTLRDRNGAWILGTPDGRSQRTMDHPVYLTNAKAKELRGLLGREVQRKNRQHQVRIPWISAEVFLSDSSLRCELDEVQSQHVYGNDIAGLPDISELINAPARPEVDSQALLVLHKLLQAVGIHPSEESRKVNQWVLEFPAFDSGPTWQDHHAHREDIAGGYSRIRIYPYGRDQRGEANESLDAAAKREYQVFKDLRHRGLLVPADFQPHEAGPTLRFDQHREAMRLDHYTATYGDRLDPETKLDMIRQLGLALHTAHEAGIVHRALSPRAVLVEPARREGKDDWLTPNLRIGEWQIASRGLGGSTTSDRIEPTTHAGRHIDDAAEPYLAPEIHNRPDGTVAVDVFGLGATAYLVTTGKPPAGDRPGLLSRLAEEGCLRPSVLADGVPDRLDELIADATHVTDYERTIDVAELLDQLAEAEQQLIEQAEEGTAVDPWEAVEGNVIDETWTVLERLGTGSSARALLVNDGAQPEKKVLKIGKDADSDLRLRTEAGALADLRHDHIACLLRENLEIGPSHAQRHAILINYAGSQTLAARLRDTTRNQLTPDQMQRFGDQLLEALEYLEKHRTWHRDIKPENIGIRDGSDSKKAEWLMLFDFSLALASAEDIGVGTPGYLDPFLGTERRRVYDWHAERYAAAVTLHELVSTERPKWGDGSCDPRVDPSCGLTLSDDLFPAAYRTELAEFFTGVLSADTMRRPQSATEMRRRFNAAFRNVDEADLPATVSDSGTETPEQLREEAVERAQRETPLESSGLTQRAVHVAQGLGINTVGELIDHNRGEILNMRGLRKKTRQDLRLRIARWREKLDTPDQPRALAAARGDERNQQHQQSGLPSDLREIAQQLIPAATKKGTFKAEMARRVLGLPGEDGTLPPERWPTQAVVARALGLDQGKAAEILRARRQEWSANPEVDELRAEIVTLLKELKRVATVDELAGTLVYDRGVPDIEDPEERRAYGCAAVRAVVEAEQVRQEQRLQFRRHGDVVVLALDVTAEDPTDTTGADQLIEFALVLGGKARELAAHEQLPTPATVVRELEQRALEKVGYVFEEQRLVRLAVAVAGEHVRANARNELYRDDMPLSRAVRIARLGAVLPRDGVGRETLVRRLEARFPGLGERLPGGEQLRELLDEALIPVKWDGNLFWPPDNEQERSSSTTGGDSGSIGVTPAGGGDITARLGQAVANGGLRILGVDARNWAAARQRLAEELEAPVVDVNAEFVAAVRAVMRDMNITDQKVVTAADAAEPNSSDANNLGRLLEMVFERLQQQWSRQPVLALDNIAPLDRYADGKRLLRRLADEVRYGSGESALRTLILLVPGDDSTAKPKEIKLISADEQIALPREWKPNGTSSTSIAGGARGVRAVNGAGAGAAS